MSVSSKATEMLRDRRTGARVRTLEIGRVFSSSEPAIDCTVIEVSERGARLVFGSEIPTAENLLLVMESLGQVRTGVVRWRTGSTIGIEYVRDPEDLLD